MSRGPSLHDDTLSCAYFREKIKNRCTRVRLEVEPREPEALEHFDAVLRQLEPDAQNSVN